MLSAVLLIRDVYPGSQILIFSIPDPESNNNKKEEGGKLLSYFFVAINFPNLEIILFLNRYRNKFEPIVKEFKYLSIFNPKNCY
jgi:hypothetical protein